MVVFETKIKNLLRESGKLHKEMCEAIGMSDAGMRKIYARNSMETSLLEKIAAFFSVPATEFFSSEHSQETPQASKSFQKGVPYYNVDFEMGFDILINDQTQNPDFLIDCKPYNKCDAFCNAYGDSMAPTISGGDIVALKRVEDIRYLVSGEIYALVTKNGLRTIKRVNDNGDTVTLIPDNTRYAPQTLPKSEIINVFAVKGTLKRF